MEHPILKTGRSGSIIKVQKRSESNVLTKLPFKTIESRGYVNAGTQQLLKPLTVAVRGFSLPVSLRKGRFFIAVRGRNGPELKFDEAACGENLDDRVQGPYNNKKSLQTVVARGASEGLRPSSEALKVPDGQLSRADEAEIVKMI